MLLTRERIDLLEGGHPEDRKRSRGILEQSFSCRREGQKKPSNDKTEKTQHIYAFRALQNERYVLSKTLSTTKRLYLCNIETQISRTFTLKYKSLKRCGIFSKFLFFLLSTSGSKDLYRNIKNSNPYCPCKTNKYLNNYLSN